jgi:ABC-type multidrug transport system fused ATPase/permease subunit
LSTVRRCDVIVQLDGGRVAAQGTYEQLLETSSSFRNLARTVA